MARERELTQNALSPVAPALHLAHREGFSDRERERGTHTPSLAQKQKQ